MQALLIYESMFGNTRDIALAVGEGIRERLPVEVVEVGAAPRVLPRDLALLVVGGPTHGHGMTTAQSRADSARRAGERLVSRGIGLREWMDELAPLPAPVPAVAFDTRIKGPALLWGSSAKIASRRLKDLGFSLVQSPRSFLVLGPRGPLFDRLVPGELDRARIWGRTMASEAGLPVVPR